MKELEKTYSVCPACYQDGKIKKIRKLKKEKNAIILAHVYQIGDVQDIADYIGDSLDLSRKAMSTKADVIVFCGVRFMAETAYLLNPTKTVLLPDENAGCGLADMATVKQLKSKKKEYPDAAVVSYVNSSAAIKAESDICCTSANAIDVVNSLPQNQMLFLPDRNLGSYVAEHTDKEVFLWDGFCYVHENIMVDQLKKIKEMHLSAEIIVHPECTISVRHFADFIGSTAQMSRHVAQSDRKEFIVGTEDNFVYRLRKENPDKKFYPAGTLCIGMNQIKLEKVKLALERMEYRVYLPEKIRAKAKNALDKMLRI
jgi:quinolinate synthase